MKFSNQVGFIGLGRMGSNMVKRLAGAGIRSVTFDANPAAVQALVAPEVTGTASLQQFVAALEAPRVIWLMLPAAVVDQELTNLKPLLSPGDVLLTQLETPLESVLAAARAANGATARVILNPAPARDLPDELLALVSVLTPNEAEAARIAAIPVGTEHEIEDAATALLRRGVGAVVITLGAAGAYVATAERRETIPGHRVEARDTTGAGDVFNGALAVALADRMPLAEAVRFANAAAAISVTRDGAQPAAPRRAEILQLLGT